MTAIPGTKQDRRASSGAHQTPHFSHIGLAYPPGTVQRQQYQDLYQPLNLAGILGPQTDEFWRSSFGQTTDGFGDAPLKQLLTPASASLPSVSMFPASNNDSGNANSNNSFWLGGNAFNDNPSQRPSTAPANSQPGSLNTMLSTATQPWDASSYPLASPSLNQTYNPIAHQAPSNPQFTSTTDFTAQPNQDNYEYTSSPDGSLPDILPADDWAQHIVSGITNLSHVLSPEKRILFVSPSAYSLIGYRPEEMVGRAMTDFIHPEDVAAFNHQFHAAVHYGTDLSVYYRLRKNDGRFLIMEGAGHARFADNTPDSARLAKLVGINRTQTVGCLCFFGSARPYPSRTSAALDSFIDLKVENQGLQSRVQSLYQQAEADGALDALQSTGYPGSGEISYPSSRSPRAICLQYN